MKRLAEVKEGKGGKGGGLGKGGRGADAALDQLLPSACHNHGVLPAAKAYALSASTWSPSWKEGWAHPTSMRSASASPSSSRDGWDVKAYCRVRLKAHAPGFAEEQAVACTQHEGAGPAGPFAVVGAVVGAGVDGALHAVHVEAEARYAKQVGTLPGIRRIGAVASEKEAMGSAGGCLDEARQAVGRELGLQDAAVLLGEDAGDASRLLGAQASDALPDLVVRLGDMDFAVDAQPSCMQRHVDALRVSDGAVKEHCKVGINVARPAGCGGGLVEHGEQAETVAGFVHPVLLISP